MRLSSSWLAMIGVILSLLPTMAFAQKPYGPCSPASTSQLGCVKGDGSTVSISPTGVLSAIGGGTSTYTIVSKTGNYPLLVADSGTWFDNNGAPGEVDFTLPTWAAGLHYCFTVVTGQIVKVIAPATVKIAIGSSNSAAAGNITASVPFASACIHAPAGPSGQWVADNDVTGTWTVN